MKRFASTHLVTVGRSVVAGPPKTPARGSGGSQMPLRASDRGYLSSVEKHRAWREQEDNAIEEEFQKKFNSNPKLPPTHKYNLNIDANGYGMRRRMRVQKGELDPKDFQKTLDGSQLAMNFK